MAERDILINFVPKNTERAEKRKTWFGICILSAVILAIMLLYYQNGLWQLAQARSANSVFKARHEEAGAWLEAQQEAEQLRQRLSQKEINIQNINQQKTPTLQLVREIEKRIPEHIKLVSLNIQSEKIILKGWADSYGQEALLISNLRNSEILGDVILIETDLVEEMEKLKFEISLERSIL
jgi:Tfp pilus assembly protein PilN